MGLLENVQQRAVGAITGLSESYQDKFKSRSIPSLEARWLRGDMIQVLRIRHNINPDSLFTRVASVHQHATGNVDEGNISRAALNIAPEPSITDIRCNSFTVRTLSKWNSLPKSVQVSKSVVKVNYDNFIWALRWWEFYNFDICSYFWTVIFCYKVLHIKCQNSLYCSHIPLLCGHLSVL